MTIRHYPQGESLLADCHAAHGLTGRPSNNAGKRKPDAKRAPLTIRLRESERQELERQATAAGRTLGEQVRMLILQQAPISPEN